VLRSPATSLIGDAGLPARLQQLNTRMAKLRISAEWMFKDVTSVWSYLKFSVGLCLLQQPVGKFYIVATDLTNIRTCLRGQCQTSLYFNCPPPTVEEYVAPHMYLPVGDDVILPDDEQQLMVANAFQELPVKFEPETVDADLPAVQEGFLAFANTEEDIHTAALVGDDGRVDVHRLGVLPEQNSGVIVGGHFVAAHGYAEV